MSAATRQSRFLVPAAASLLLACATACETLDPAGRSILGPTTGVAARTDAAPTRVDPRTAAARTQTRIEQLEESSRRMQAELDAMEQSQQHVAAQAEARLHQARQEAAAAASEVEALRREVASLRTEQQQLRKILDDLPGRISKAVAAATPPATAAASGTRRNTGAGASSAPSSGRAAVGYEHVVEAGQTLSEIAQAYKVRVDAIVKENGLKDAGSIRVGQKLFIPKP